MDHRETRNFKCFNWTIREEMYSCVIAEHFVSYL
jgi:hypothetical protein